MAYMNYASSVEVIRCTLQNPDVKIFKRLVLTCLMLLPQFSFNVNQTLQKACNPWKKQAITFPGDLLHVKYMAL